MWDWGNLYGNQDTGTFGETFGDSPEQPQFGAPQQAPSRNRMNRQFANGNPFMNAAGNVRRRFTDPNAMQRWAQRNPTGGMGNMGWGQDMSFQQPQADFANAGRQTAWGSYQANPGQYQPAPMQGMPYMGDQQPNFGGY